MTADRSNSDRIPEPRVAFLAGLPFHLMTMADTVAEAIRVVEERTPRYFVTANADFVAQAYENKRLRDIVIHAHRAVCDGMPLIWLSRLFPPALPERVAGSDFVFELFREGNDRGWRFFFLGSDEPTLAKASQILRQRYPGMILAGAFSPPIAKVEEWPNETITSLIQETKPDVLLVAVGCPKQEYWIDAFSKSLGIPLSVGIGASLDFIAGKQVRAPRWMQKAGLEWVWRMLTDPGRLVARYWKDFRYLFVLSIKQWRLTRRSQGNTLNLQAEAQTSGTSHQAHVLAWVGTVEAGNVDAHPLPPPGNPIILLDLSDVTFIDSAGIGRLLQAARQCREQQQAFALLRPSPQVRRIIDSLRLDGQFIMIENPADFAPPLKP
jgi:N-acetylglucosaminyldiphosphoundecaprenol N-acetyl-beta-D-mannosaminyltransferase